MTDVGRTLPSTPLRAGLSAAFDLDSRIVNPVPQDMNQSQKAADRPALSGVEGSVHPT
jgi:hypothetical protein